MSSEYEIPFSPIVIDDVAYVARNIHCWEHVEQDKHIDGTTVTRKSYSGSANVYVDDQPSPLAGYSTPITMYIRSSDSFMHLESVITDGEKEYDVDNTTVCYIEWVAESASKNLISRENI